jgi:hypothetical protein
MRLVTCVSPIEEPCKTMSNPNEKLTGTALLEAALAAEFNGKPFADTPAETPAPSTASETGTAMLRAALEAELHQ